MHIFKFPWLTHKEGNHNFEIYCLAVSPDGKRLASGGLDGKIRIWSIDTLRKYARLASSGKQITLDPKECRHLCSMSRHTGAVTCLKFSPNGRFLASGSDDRILLIWEKDAESSGIVGNLDMSGDVEHWTVRRRLVAHDNDIQDMAWAPDSSILVTVGLDRSVIVWSGTTFEKIKRFDIHESHVKGVTFDPANKYFATCSDDRTMRIFRYRRSSPTEISVTVECVVREPFKNTPLTTYYRRCSWSPDGQYVAAPNAVNGGICSVAVVKRGSWQADISLLGHELPCEVCAFSPRLYEVGGKNSGDKNSTGKNPAELSTVLATAGQDRCLVLWDTASPIPLVIAKDLAHKTVTDLCWDPTGRLLLLSSLDGTITAAFFDRDELGHPIPLDQNAAQLHRYGADRDSSFFPESTEQLKLEDLQASPAANRMDRLMTGLGSGTGGFAKPSTPIHARPTVNVLVPRSRKHPNRKVHLLTARSQKVSITKSGRRRVAPTLVSAAHPAVRVVKPVKASASERRAIYKVMSRPSTKIPHQGLQTLVASIRDNLIQLPPTRAANSAGGAGPGNSAGGSGSAAQHKFTHAFPAPHRLLKYRPARAARRSRRPQGRNLAWWSGCTGEKPGMLLAEKDQVTDKSQNSTDSFADVLEVRNDTELDSTGESPMISTAFVRDGHLADPAFRYFVNDQVGQVAESRYESVDYWALGTESGRIHVISRTGRLLIPAIQLGSALVHLAAQNQYLLAVTEKAELYTWDLKESKGIVLGESLAPLIDQFATFDRHRRKFHDDVSVVSVEFGLHGAPIVVLSNNYIYSYDTELCTWINVIDPWYLARVDRKECSSEFNQCLPLKLAVNHILRRLEPAEPSKDDIAKTVKKSFASINQALNESIKANNY